MSYQTSKTDLQFLSSLMVNPKKISYLDKAVSTNDFTSPLYYEIYLRIAEFFIEDKTATYTDLKFKFKGDKLVLDIIDQVEDQPPIEDINLIYDELCEVSRKKRLKNLSTKLKNQIETKEESLPIIESLQSDLALISLDQKTDSYMIEDFENDYVTDIKKRTEKYRKSGSVYIEAPTGLSTLDSITLGLQKKNMWVIGGGTSDGKTQLAVQITNSLVLNKNQVFYFMLEDAREQLITRFCSLNTGIPISKIRTGELVSSQINDIQSVLSKLKKDNRLLIDDTAIDINEIVTKTKFGKLKFPFLSVVVLDHINCAVDRMSNKGNREQEINSISKKLVTLAKSCDIAVLVLQQVNTNPDERTKGMPITMNDLRDSKTPSHDSAICTLIHCPDKYDEGKKYSRKHTQLIVAKNRYGETNKIIDLTSQSHIGRFKEGVPK